MNPRVPDLPDWTFTVKEVSASVYQVTAKDSAGHNIELNGFDPDELLNRCKEEIRKIMTK
jgi:hypothetical protein